MSELKILFFASLRDKLGVAQIALPYQPNETVANLIQRIISVQGDAYLILQDTCINAAINAQLANASSPVPEGAEIAFFPPVTGG